MNNIVNRSAFTLLEVIVVVIIIGVLASLALPRYIRTIEYSRGSEALIQLSAVRQSLERYYLPKNSYTGATLDSLDVENPNSVPRSHFSYTVTVLTPTTYSLVATRNSFEGGDGTSAITIDQSGIKTGTGNYSSIR